MIFSTIFCSKGCPHDYILANGMYLLRGPLHASLLYVAGMKMRRLEHVHPFWIMEWRPHSSAMTR